MATPNPPIRGHHLLHEGNVWRVRDPFWSGEDKWEGGCACGAKPPEFPAVSARKMKAWHRQHKAELRGQQLHDTVTAEMQVVVLKELIKDFESWAEHQDWCDGFSGQETCSCGLGPLLGRTKALDAVSPADVVPTPAEPAEIPIQVDTRPRCNAPHPDGGTLACDKPRGHSDSHEAYYGWTSRAEVWS